MPILTYSLLFQLLSVGQGFTSVTNPFWVGHSFVLGLETNTLPGLVLGLGDDWVRRYDTNHLDKPNKVISDIFLLV